MFTRNQKIEIDFDEASRAWNANKKKTGNGCYIYVCGTLLKNGKHCQNSTACHIHKKTLLNHGK